MKYARSAFRKRTRRYVRLERTQRTFVDRWKVDGGITVHFIEGRVNWPRVRASERKGIRSSTASSTKRTEGGKSSKGCSGTAHRARKKRPFRPFRDRRVRHLISLSLTGRYFSVLRFLTLFYLYTRGKTNPLPSLNRHVRRPFWKKGLISGIAFRSEYKVRMCNANLFPRKRLTQDDVLFGRAVKH